MRFGRHPAILGGSGGYAFIRALQPAAWFRADTGVTVTGLGASMVADQDDPDNALVLPGVAGNYASAPDSVPLSFTGDCDFIARVRMPDWTASTTLPVIAKRNTDAYQLSVIGTTGVLRLNWWDSGGTLKTADSTSAPTVTDGAALWIRATLDVDNGAAGNDVKFYTAADQSGVPTSWSQLGTTVTGAGTTTVRDTNAELRIGQDAGVTVCAASIYRAIIKSGIDGTTVFDANFAAQAKGTTSFSESSSNAATVTVNQSGALPAHIGSQKDLLQGTDASRPPYLSYSGTKYLYLPGVAGNYASTPDVAANSITGDIDIRVRVSLDDWTPSANVAFVSKNLSGTESYRLIMTATNFLRLDVQVSGSLRSAAATAATGFTDGSAYWIRVTRASASGNVNFYTAADSDSVPTSWTQLGNADVATTAGDITDSAQALAVGASPGGATLNLTGKIYRASIYSTIGGTTPVVDFNPNLDADGDGDTSFASSATGETWTVNSSGGLPAQIVGRPSLLFDGVADYLKCNAFTLNQPETVYIAFKQVSWTLNDTLYDGDGAGNRAAIFQTTSSPRISINAGSTAAENSGLAVGTYGVLCGIFNGASSLTQVNLAAPSTGNAGASNAAGITLGAGFNGTVPANIQVLEVIIFSTAHDATQRARVIQYLAGRHGIAL